LSIFFISNELYDLHLIDLEECEVILYILVCIPLFILGIILCFMENRGNNNTYDSDLLATDLSQYIGRRFRDVGYTFQHGTVLSYNNVTLMYIRNYGTNLT
jgi:hypothetical protein